MGNHGFGKSYPRIEDARLLRGGGRYIDDMVLPRMAQGYVLRSPHAHAKIRAIDATAAMASPGVLRVLTGADWQASGFAELPSPGRRKRRDGTPMYRPHYPALPSEKVRWVGEPVAFVVAETLAQAIDAAELIEVDYEPLPAVVSAVAAIADGAPLVYDDCPNNICFVHIGGNEQATNDAFAKATHVVRHRFVLNRVTAATMEPRGSIADYDPMAERYTVYSTMQRPHVFRTSLSRVLQVPENAIRVVGGDIGGSFGMKTPVYSEVALVCLASRLLGRPVKWISTRSESFLSDAQGRDVDSLAELALDDDGNFLGLRVRNTVALGAYSQAGSDGAPVVNLGTLANVYTTPAIHVDVTAVYTNTNPVRSYRGNGRPEAAYVIERLVDMAADDMGIDPIELRRRNVIAPESMPFTTPLRFVYDCGEFGKNMDMVLAMADYPGIERRRAAARSRGKLLGFGFSNSIEKAASPGYEGMEIRFDPSGAATIFSGAFSHGQGHETVFTQLICDRLGLEPKDVRYISGDTDKVFFGIGTGGSRTATIAGAALHFAAEKIVAKGRLIAAHILQADPAEVTFADGLFTAPRSNRSLTIREIAKAAAGDDLPDGVEPGLAVTHVHQHKIYNYPNGSHACEVEVDEETGEVQVTRYFVVDDVGTVMNPLLLQGQILGGLAQGLGQVLMEDIRWDADSGQLLTGSFMDYAMPRAGDFSPVVLKSNPVPTKSNPLGVKGAGEAGTVGAMPALANALVDALSVYGLRHVPMPATAERLWRLMQEARARG